MNYKINRESKSGVMNRNRIIGGVSIAIAIGTIVATSLFIKANNESYAFDKNFNSYSNQLEAMLDVDINNSNASALDRFQTYIGHIEDYNSGMGELVENVALKGLNEGKKDIINIGLDIAKQYVASKNQGEASEWKLHYESSDGTWLATREGSGSVTLSGDISALASSIGKLQNYENKEEIEDKDTFVDLCDELIQNAGKVTVDMSKKI